MNIDTRAMTPEAKKQYLCKAYRIDKLIQSHAEELQILRATIGSIGAGGDGTPGAPRYNGNTAEISAIIKTVDLEAQLQKEITSMGQRWKRIHDSIEELASIDERLILRYRYIQGLSWNEIEAEMNYSRSQMFKIHDQAIENLRPIMTEAKHDNQNITDQP